MATATTDQKMLGFMEFASGPAGKDIIKRSDDVTIPLRNVMKAYRVTLADGSTVLVADVYCPAGGITNLASLTAMGYNKLGKGSTIRTGDGKFFIKTSDAGATETWATLTTTALA